MKKYNLSIDRTANEQEIIQALEARGVRIDRVFTNLYVLCVTADPGACDVPGVINIEEEQTLIPVPQATWQQLRVASETLPLRKDVRSVYRGAGATVYLVDTGIDLTHPELVETHIVQLWSHDNSFTPANHGTTLATLIAGSTIGISPDATIKSVHIPVGQGVSVSTLLSAFDAILTDHSLTEAVKVVNCSWIINKSQILDSEITQLQNAGLVIVAAAGNQGVAADNFSPVGLDSVLGVGASDAYDRVIAWATGSSSNWGPEVDITAPGIEVTVLNPDGSQATESGTSVAAAITSAVVCHFLEHLPAASSTEIQEALIGMANVDVLFRNETIYGTTPNRLLRTYTPRNVNIWGDLRQTQQFAIQRGTQREIPIVFGSPIVSVSLKNVKWSNGFDYLVPAWAVLEEGVLKLTPPEDLTTGKYTIIVTGVDDQGSEFPLILYACVYVNDVSELATVSGETYLTPDDEYVTLQLQFCNYRSDCPPEFGWSCCNHVCTCCDYCSK